MRHNVGWMQRYAQGNGVAFAPHGKTTMSPQLFREQLAAGAWGLTFATATQLRVGVAAGARRILIANQVLQERDLEAIAALQRDDPGLRVLFLLDSLAQLLRIERFGNARPFEVLLEIGVPNGRTGVRSLDEAVALARLARASAAVRLAGIECYEGLGVTGDSGADQNSAASLMRRVADVALRCDRDNLFETDEVIVSAGGSAVFDLVVPALKPELSRPAIGLLRSGCYVTHDHGFYRRLVSVANERMGCADTGLQAALEVWTLVQSQPEAGLAILAVGKRDISYDLDLPVPIGHAPARARSGAKSAASTVRAAPQTWRITGLNDQHAYLRVPADCGLRVADMVASGISHPCTTFDKWRLLMVVNEAYDVISALKTYF
jgi:D-serine dehydratase